MKHELLAPAGSLEICKAVIDAGADAVYLGGDKFGARAYAKNFTRENLLEALDYAHLYGRKIFLTVNTLLKNREIGRELYDYLEPFYRYGLDAIIVQDYGVFQFVRKNFPDLPIHASTQMSVADAAGAAFLKAQGAARIVTARELSLEEIHKIYTETGVEIESFIHGALCYSYSGQCLMSSMLGGRSGNRGRCAQPCRLAYQVLDEQGRGLREKENYPLSPKDLCTLSLLPKLCASGIYSFKIEGRMKQLSYAAGVTEIYRKYLDLYEKNPAAWSVEERDLEDLLQLGNRSGFTKGYYEVRNGRAMMTLKDSSHSSGQAKDVYQPGEAKKLSVCGHAVLKKGQPALLTLRCQDMEHTETADIVQEAQNRPLLFGDVQERLKKTGDTPFVFTKLKVDMDEDIFLPVKTLNELRRKGLACLKQKLLESKKRNGSGSSPVFAGRLPEETPEGWHPGLHVYIASQKMLPEVLESACVDDIFLDFPFDADLMQRCADRIRKAGKKVGFCFPYVFRENTRTYFAQKKAEFLKIGFDTVVVRSYDSLSFAARELGIEKEKILLDYNLYVFSDEAAGAFASAGFARYTASLELNQKELHHMPNHNSEFWLYGYVPLMISAQCVYKNYDKCYRDKKESEKNLYLKDRYFKKFFIKRNCKDCYNIIYNSQPVSLFHQADLVEGLGFASYRISFVSEDTAQIRRVLRTYEEVFVSGGKTEAPQQRDSYTNGHFKRGVE